MPKQSIIIKVMQLGIDFDDVWSNTMIIYFNISWKSLYHCTMSVVKEQYDFQWAGNFLFIIQDDWRSCNKGDGLESITEYSNRYFNSVQDGQLEFVAYRLQKKLRLISVTINYSFL